MTGAKDLIPLKSFDSLARSWSFRLLLEEGEPVSPMRLAEASGLSFDEVVAELDAIEAEGRLRRDDEGRVVGSSGLSVEPTRHVLRFSDGRVRWTWCAVDAVSIMSAVNATGEVQSPDQRTGANLTLRFTNGVAEPNDAVIFIAYSDNEDIRVVDQWCPVVNFFESRSSGEAWIQQSNAMGEIWSITEVAEAGAAGWRELLTATEP